MKHSYSINISCKKPVIEFCSHQIETSQLVPQEYESYMTETLKG